MYTWGKIRLLVQQWAGTAVSLDAIDHAINSTYRLILSRIEWKDLDLSGFLPTSASYNMGSVSVAQGSTAVVGLGTVWTAALNGMQLFVGAAYDSYTVTVTSNTTLLLDRPFEDVTGGMLSYWIVQQAYRLPDNCRSLQTISSPYSGLSLEPMSTVEYAELVGASSFGIGGLPTNYVPQPNQVNPKTGAICQAIMIYPIPVDGRAYPIAYKLAAGGFNGTNVTDGPLPFVSDAMMVAGAKAAVARDKRWAGDVATFAAEFEMHFAAELHVEVAKLTQRHHQMQNHYSNHRVLRTIRNAGAIWRGGIDDTSGSAN